MTNENHEISMSINSSATTIHNIQNVSHAAVNNTSKNIIECDSNDTFFCQRKFKWYRGY